MPAADWNLEVVAMSVAAPAFSFTVFLPVSPMASTLLVSWV